MCINWNGRCQSPLLYLASSSSHSTTTMSTTLIPIAIPTTTKTTTTTEYTATPPTLTTIMESEEVPVTPQTSYIGVRYNDTTSLVHLLVTLCQRAVNV